RDAACERVEVRRLLGAGQRAGAGDAGDRGVAQFFQYRVRRLLGEDAVGGELAAGHREQAGHAVARLVVEDLVTAGQRVRTDAPLEEGVADAGPGAQRAPAPRLGQGAGGGFDHVLDLVARDLRVHARWVAVVVVIGGPDDRFGAVRDQEEGAAVDAFQDQPEVADPSLEGDVNPLARAERHAGAGERGDARGPRARGVEHQPCLDVARTPVQPVPHAYAAHAAAREQQLLDLRVREEVGA